MGETSGKQKATRRAILRRADQAVVAIMVSAGLVALVAYVTLKAATSNRFIDIDRREPLQAQFQVDVNQAEWPEFAQLPGIGETLARRIVDERGNVVPSSTTPISN